MYVIRFYRSLPTIVGGEVFHSSFAEMPGKFSTPEEAGQHRYVGGDIVVDEKTGLPSTSLKWLFEWEKKDKDCWAQRMRRFSMGQLSII